MVSATFCIFYLELMVVCRHDPVVADDAGQVVRAVAGDD